MKKIRINTQVAILVTLLGILLITECIALYGYFKNRSNTTNLNKLVYINVTNDKGEPLVYSKSTSKETTVRNVFDSLVKDGSFTYEMGTNDAGNEVLMTVNGLTANEEDVAYWEVYVNKEVANDDLSDKVNSKDVINVIYQKAQPRPEVNKPDETEEPTEEVIEGQEEIQEQTE